MFAIRYISLVLWLSDPIVLLFCLYSHLWWIYSITRTMWKIYRWERMPHQRLCSLIHPLCIKDERCNIAFIKFTAKIISSNPNSFVYSNIKLAYISIHICKHDPQNVSLLKHFFWYYHSYFLITSNYSVDLSFLKYISERLASHLALLASLVIYTCVGLFLPW